MGSCALCWWSGWQCTVYDGMNVALAVQQDCLLLPADERLSNALCQGPYGVRARWAGE